MENVTLVIGRILLAHIFLLSGISKIGAYAGTQGYMDSMGVPGMLLPLVMLVEIGGALLLILGWLTRWGALALAGFSILAALFFHANFSDQMQMIQFMKNLSMAGGLLVLAAAGPGDLSLDYKRSRRL